MEQGKDGKKHLGKKEKTAAVLLTLTAALVILWYTMNRAIIQEAEETVETMEKTIAVTEKKPGTFSGVSRDMEVSGELDALEEQLSYMVAEAEGSWSIYVKDLDTQETFTIHDTRMYAASLIKLFAMEYSYQNMDALVTNDSTYSGSEAASREKIDGLLRSMIEASDNESFNELVRMQSEDRSFTEGCKKINAYLKKSPYNETGIYHTLHPSASAQESISKQRNYTSAEDCGMLLERIYEGTCVSREASEEMKNLLLHQRLTEKIPAGVPQGVEVANKTGETDSTQHDAAIVFGPETDYILCVMSSGLTDGDEAVLMVKKISTEVYNYLNK